MFPAVSYITLQSGLNSAPAQRLSDYNAITDQDHRDKRLWITVLSGCGMTFSHWHLVFPAVSYNTLQSGLYSASAQRQSDYNTITDQDHRDKRLWYDLLTLASSVPSSIIQHTTIRAKECTCIKMIRLQYYH
ncbi:hypothetical protein J6590_016765 [Homalodisca vitripennis]|nr:hypothetical protein J6590_016765 [Homalodisca vitripennis]